jgi:hypothetical protein
MLVINNALPSSSADDITGVISRLVIKTSGCLQYILSKVAFLIDTFGLAMTMTSRNIFRSFFKAQFDKFEDEAELIRSMLLYSNTQLRLWRFRSFIDTIFSLARTSDELAPVPAADLSHMVCTAETAGSLFLHAFPSCCLYRRWSPATSDLEM